MQILTALRSRAGFSVSRAASKIGVCRGAVYAWEQGQRRPQPELLRRALDLYEATEDERCQVAHLYALGPDPVATE